MKRSTVGTTATYLLRDRLHAERAVRVPAHEIASTVSVWLAELGARSPLAEELARAVHTGNWAAARGISEYLSIDIALT